MTPPWAEIYGNDADRRHGFQEAVAEYERLLIAFTALAYTVEVLPRVSVDERADIVVQRLKST
jgi:predicted ATPase